MRKLLIAILLLVFYCGSAFAGDEVDYSAPYLTLENGELVTKYPAKEHDPNKTAPEASLADIADEPEPAKKLPAPWGIAFGGLIGALVVFLVRKGIRKRPDRQADSIE